MEQAAGLLAVSESAPRTALWPLFCSVLSGFHSTCFAVRLHALHSASVFCNLILACFSGIFYSQEPSVIKCWKYMETESELASVFVSDLFDLFTRCLDTSPTLAHPSFTIFLSLISVIAASVYIIYCCGNSFMSCFPYLASTVWPPSVVLQRNYFSFSVDNFNVYCYWWSLVY